MRFGIERHRSRAALGLQRLKDCQFTRRFFSHDCGRAVSARDEREQRCAIKRTAIDAGANGNRVDHLSGFGI